MAVECSLLPRRPCRFGGARRRCAWCRRRPAALAAPRRAALVTSRALRGAFWHVSACQRRYQARLPCLRPRACGRARQARRSSARVFELAAGDEPAWLVARREPAQYALARVGARRSNGGEPQRAAAQPEVWRRRGETPRDGRTWPRGGSQPLPWAPATKRTPPYKGDSIDSAQRQLAARGT